MKLGIDPKVDNALEKVVGSEANIDLPTRDMRQIQAVARHCHTIPEFARRSGDGSVYDQSRGDTRPSLRTRKAGPQE